MSSFLVYVVVLLKEALFPQRRSLEYADNTRRVMFCILLAIIWNCTRLWAYLCKYNYPSGHSFSQVLSVRDSKRRIFRNFFFSEYGILEYREQDFCDDDETDLLLSDDETDLLLSDDETDLLLSDDETDLLLSDDETDDFSDEPMEFEPFEFEPIHFEEFYKAIENAIAHSKTSLPNAASAA